jgi:hypothetical protein
VRPGGLYTSTELNARILVKVDGAAGDGRFQKREDRRTETEDDER